MIAIALHLDRVPARPLGPCHLVGLTLLSLLLARLIWVAFIAFGFARERARLGGHTHRKVTYEFKGRSHMMVKHYINA